MSVVEIPLNSFVYRFRRLAWQQEMQIPLTDQEDQRKTLLSHALTDISGLRVNSVEEARKVLDQIPPALFWRIWILYRGNLPEDRYYTSKGLFDAPDLKTYNKRVFDDERQADSTADAATRRMEQQGLSGQMEREAIDIQNRIVADAKKRGILHKVTS
jgi:hypothetical protein